METPHKINAAHQNNKKSVKSVHQNSKKSASSADGSVLPVINRAPILIGDSPAIERIRHVINRIAPSRMNVLITGESGTGKEEVARLIHEQSNRAATLFTAINCAAFAAELVESELFGHERGAFTGASAQRIGKLEAADGSTLLLDEIGEMPLALQAKLLRFLQEQEIQRVGSNRTIKLNVRIIAATNRVLPEEIKSGRFRTDLYYRLQICHIEVPPLREHRSDIRQLVAHSAKLFAGDRQPPVFTEETLQVLEQQVWNGNVRELVNVVEFAVNMCADNVVTINDLPDRICTCLSASEGKYRENEGDKPHTTRLRISPLARAKVVRQIIAECDGNKTLAAKEMGISRQRLHQVLKESRDQF